MFVWRIVPCENRRDRVLCLWLTAVFENMLRLDDSLHVGHKSLGLPESCDRGELPRSRRGWLHREGGGGGGGGSLFVRKTIFPFLLLAVAMLMVLDVLRFSFFSGEGELIKKRKNGEIYRSHLW